MLKYFQEYFNIFLPASLPYHLCVKAVENILDQSSNQPDFLYKHRHLLLQQRPVVKSMHRRPVLDMKDFPRWRKNWALSFGRLDFSLQGHWVSVWQRGLVGVCGQQWASHRGDREGWPTHQQVEQPRAEPQHCRHHQPSPQPGGGLLLSSCRPWRCSNERITAGETRQVQGGQQSLTERRERSTL